MTDDTPETPSDELSELRAAWDSLARDDSGDARTLAIVSELRRAWRGLAPPTLPESLRVAPRFALRRVAALGAPLLAAACLLFALRDADRDGPRGPSEAANPHPSDSRLVADLTLATLGNGSVAFFLPVACLCCEALLLSDPAVAPAPPLRSAVDQAIAEAIAADCRGEWSQAAATLAPILDRDHGSLTYEQRTRAGVAFVHASRQLGRTDDARRAELAMSR